MEEGLVEARGGQECEGEGRGGEERGEEVKKGWLDEEEEEEEVGGKGGEEMAEGEARETSNGGRARAAPVEETGEESECEGKGEGGK